MFRPVLAFLLLLIPAITVSALEEILAPTRTTAFETYYVSPYTPSCRYFRIAVKHDKRRLGFLAFDTERASHVAQDPHRAGIFRFGPKGGLRKDVFAPNGTRIDSFFVGSRRLAAKRGWGPLKLHPHPTAEYHFWEIPPGDDHIHFRSPEYTFGDGEALFCRAKPKNTDKRSVIFAQYDKAVPNYFKCIRVRFKAQCVDNPSNPSDTPDPYTLEDRSDFSWKAGRRTVVV